MQIKKHLLDIFVIILGNIVMSFGYAQFMVPYNIINGGVTSLALITSSFFNAPIDIMNVVIMFLLLVLVTLFLGKEILVKSIMSSIVYAVFFSYFVNHNFNLDCGPIVSMLLASILVAFGYFCCLVANSSTVGMDVIALILNKYRDLPLKKTIRVLNILILGIGFFVYGYESVILGIIFSYIYSFELGMFLKHLSNRYKMI